MTALVQDGKEVSEVSNGEFFLLTNQTPFYGEMGGQVGDKGKITGKDLEIEVTDTKKKLDGLYVHIAKIVKGRIKNGDIVLMEVCESNRKAIEANHTVTHLLHHALQEKIRRQRNTKKVLWLPPKECVLTSPIPSKSAKTNYATWKIRLTA